MSARTTHEAAAQSLYASLLRDDGWADLLAAWSRRIGTGEVPVSAFAVYGQAWRGGGFSPEQLAAAVYMHTMTMNGHYAWRTYFLPDVTGPAPDSARAANAATLAALPPPLRAHIDPDQNCGDSDGTLTWDVPLELNRSMARVDDDDELIVEHILISPSSAPLEIGTTMPSRTLMHLEMEGRAVARWPYGADYVQLLINCAPPPLQLIGHRLGEEEPADHGLISGRVGR